MRRRGLSLIELLIVIAIILTVLSLVIVALAKAFRVVENFKK